MHYTVNRSRLNTNPPLHGTTAEKIAHGAFWHLLAKVGWWADEATLPPACLLDSASSQCIYVVARMLANLDAGLHSFRACWLLLAPRAPIQRKARKRGFLN